MPTTLTRLLIVALVVVLLTGCAEKNPDYVYIPQANISIYKPWAERASYVWAGPDGMSYQVDLPRQDGCYYLFPPLPGAVTGRAVWYGEQCVGVSTPTPEEFEG